MRVIVLCLMCFGLALAQNTMSESKAVGYVPIQFAQDDDNLLVPKTKEFIDRLGAELLEKTGFLLKVVVVEDSQKALAALSKDLAIESTESIPNFAPTTKSDSRTSRDARAQARELYRQYLQDSALSKPYAMIVMYVKDQQIEFVLSDREVFDKELEERVYFEYMVPLLPKRGESPKREQISAIMFNGYSEAADLVALHYGKTLELNVPRDENGGKEFVKISMMSMLVILLGVLGFVYITSRFLKK
ncbi:hypothetical protein [uncultured Helicobacter sp.]|uniref:hypothetical protein n=1 Tax=uncultured Helicobacter sp. TaxID=175537 RepID=UPI00375013B3